MNKIDAASTVMAADGVTIAYTFDGPAGAPALLLSNSLGTTMRMWKPQLPVLAARFRVLRYDSRGHGRSGRPPGPATITTLGQDALALLDALGVERAHVAGVSMGGMTAMWLAAHAPGRVDRVVLACTAANMPPPEAWDARIAAVRAGGLGAIVEGSLERWFTPAFRATSPDAVADTRAMFLANDDEGYCACVAAIRDMDLRPDLARITAPTTIIAGHDDPVVNAAQVETMHTGIAGAEVAWVPGAHLANIEASTAFDEALLRGLEAFATYPGQPA